MYQIYLYMEGTKYGRNINIKFNLPVCVVSVSYSIDGHGCNSVISRLRR